MRYAYFFFIIICLSSCAAQKTVTEYVTQHDTVQVFRVRTDSLIVRDTLIQKDSVFIQESVRNDTVFRKEYVYKYLYKPSVIYKPRYVYDSVFITKTDTIRLESSCTAQLTVWQKVKMKAGGVSLFLMAFAMVTGAVYLFMHFRRL